jgi:hypothetical protein
MLEITLLHAPVEAVNVPAQRPTDTLKLERVYPVLKHDGPKAEPPAVTCRLEGVQVPPFPSYVTVIL